MMTRAEIWAMIAAARMTRQYAMPPETAKAADDMLAEFDKRFEWHEVAGGGTWISKKRDKDEAEAPQ
jgi:hypothetical protein